MNSFYDLKKISEKELVNAQKVDWCNNLINLDLMQEDCGYKTGGCK